MAGGTFLGLNTATLGLMASQNAIETASHNIDNANTPGYSRERVDLVTSPSLEEWGLSSQGPGQIGTGVQVGDITRLRSQFLDGQYRDQNQALGQSQVQQNALNQITGIMNEPSSTGISNALQQFWSAWDTLQSNPAELSARTQVQQSGVTLAQTLNQTSNQLSALQNNEQNSLNSRVTQANSLISQVANLTAQIQQQQATPGVNANDLLDQRDELLDQISQLGTVSVTQTANSFQVMLGGTGGTGGALVVSNGQAATLSVSGTGTSSQIVATPYVSNSFSSTPPLTPVSSPGGELQGTLDALKYVQNYSDNLDNLAQALANGPMTVSIPGGSTQTVNGINGLEEIGYSEDGPGQAFFVTNNGSSTITAANIAVELSPTQIAAATSAQPGTNPAVAMSGDGSLAGAISSVKNQQTTFPNPAAPTQTMQGSVSDYLQAVVSELGIQGQTANNNVKNNQALVQQVDTQRQSVSGVSIDEEMTNVIQYQQAYNASAKMVDTINQMLQTLISEV